MDTLWEPRPPAADDAAAVALVHGSDAAPGFHRRRAGKGFTYVGPDGARVTDPVALDRIHALVIPPAWSEVWIAPSPDWHLQVTGKDVRGRKQYRYHERWTACRDEVKYSNLVEFARVLPRLRGVVEQDLARRGLPRERVLATVVWLLDNTLIRVGNLGYARDNGSFGLTTLRDRHVRIDGSTLRFDFVGKSGKTWRLKVTDRRIARIVKQTRDLPGQHLFQYLDAEGDRRSVASQDVNDYIRAAGAGAFSSKHFRTWGGTVRAVLAFEAAPPPSSQRALNRARNAVVDTVAARLGNTRAICRKCYVHPRVFESWEAGRLAEEMAAIRRRYRRAPEGMEREEYLVLRWLETEPALGI